MHYNFYFDICAICILVTIAVISMSRRWVPAYRHRAYAMLYLTVLFATLSERIETFLQMHPMEASWYHCAEMITGSIYFICHLGSGFFYLLYVFSVLDIYMDFRKFKDFVLLYLCYAVGIILVIVNFFVPILFAYDETGLYHRCDLIVIYYILAAYYLFYGFILMVRYRDLMRLRTKAVVYSYIFLVIAGILIQYYYPTVLIENFLTVLSITLVYITLQNPSEMVDEKLNILNRKAFLEGLELKTGRKSYNHTVFVTIDNIRALSDEIGYSQAQNVLKRIARYLKKVGHKEMKIQTYAYRYSENMFAVAVNIDDDEMTHKLMELIATRLKEPWTFGNMAIRVEGHCFLMNYPNNYSNVGDLMIKLDLIADEVASEPDIIFDINKTDFEERKKAKDFDFLARNNLDSRTAVIKFQPMLSKVYKINYSAEVYCYLTDEDGNEVDMRGKVPDIAVTQALLDTDEFVYRRACRALAFWNGGDKNGKYRAIVGMSQGEISRNDFIRRIKKIAREERAEASWITIRLSETNVSTMNATAERNLKLLRDMGCSLIIDNFGSGYGDLQRILSLPVTQINIAHDIITQSTKSEQMKMVTQGIVNLFHDISIFVGASNISSEEEKLIAEELGCDFLMGDYLCEPMKDSSFVKYIDDYFE